MNGDMLTIGNLSFLFQTVSASGKMAAMSRCVERAERLADGWGGEHPASAVEVNETEGASWKGLGEIDFDAPRARLSEDQGFVVDTG